MKPLLAVSVLTIFVNLACAQQPPQDSLLPLDVTLTLGKEIYNEGESIDFEIRIDNNTPDTMRIYKAVDVHYLPKMYKPNGEIIPFDWSIPVLINVKEEETFELLPGHFYGTSTSWPGNVPAGTYTFHVVYCNPINTGDPLDHYMFGKVRSDTVDLIIRQK